MTDRPKMPCTPHDEVMASIYRDDPDYALKMLNAVLNDCEPNELLIALRQVTIAFTRIALIAQRPEPEAKQIFSGLPADGNPSIVILIQLLKALGLRLTVEPMYAA